MGAEPLSSRLAGIDIGGTKCAVCIGEAGPAGARVIGKQRFPTPPTPDDTLARIDLALQELVGEYGPVHAAGVSCGGPLDSRRGLILSPPNLPGWDRIDVLTPLKRQLGVPSALQNDANASALAEWSWGAGRGCRNMIFLTFGTGMGAGLILDGRLYSGTNDLAGEVGHIRLEKHGPVGYGKAGSFEGFCSGGGIALLGRDLAEQALREGSPPAFCPTPEDLPAVTAEAIGRAARRGDPLALQVFEMVARQLGRGLAVLVDVLNPERIVIGSIYARQRELLEPRMLEAMAEEALTEALAVCEVVPAGLGESIGNLASLSVALSALDEHNR